MRTPCFQTTVICSVAFLSCLFAIDARGESDIAKTTASIAEPKRVDLFKGNAVVDSDRHTLVNTPVGLLSVKPGAQAFVMIGTNGVAIFVLNETKRGSVKFIAEKKEITLAPGQEIVITRQPKPSFEEVNPGKMFPYRIVSQHDLGNGVTLFNAEYAVLSLVKSVKPLKTKLLSNDEKEQQKMRGIIKVGLIVNAATPTGDKFSTELKPKSKHKQ